MEELRLLARAVACVLDADNKLFIKKSLVKVLISPDFDAALAAHKNI